MHVTRSTCKELLHTISSLSFLMIVYAELTKVPSSAGKIASKIKSSKKGVIIQLLCIEVLLIIIIINALYTTI